MLSSRDNMESEKSDISENCDPNSVPSAEKTAQPTEELDCENAKKPNKAEIKTIDECMETELGKVNEERVDFKVVFNKSKYDITFGWDKTIKELKLHLEDIIGVVQNAQKIMIKGMAKDEMTLRTAGIISGCKVMVVGSKMNDILAVTSVKQQFAADEKSLGSTSTKEPLCEQKIHRKVLDKGVPPDAMPGILGTKEPLPPVPLSGMLNKHGGKVRLTFKLELDQVWVGTKERTEKLALTSIKGITSEPIKGHEQYHIMALQLGPTDASRYWIYWVPAQYLDAIKEAILDKWQLF
ncbi:ubiquitin domain-containing protein UBFD1-like [Arctopsyche grandis]|uniref:ubiquitin domain-containing protein UBFD1-like n=1 Tax=Arctopsyche grandis TaxID=121162 RepID=UPI00406D88DD